MAATRTMARTATTTVTRLALVSQQFSRFLQRFPEGTMDEALRTRYLDHIRRRNIDRVSLVGTDGGGAAVVLVRCTVDWGLHMQNCLIAPEIEVVPGKEGREITVANLDAFDQVVAEYELQVSARVRLTPLDATRDELMSELRLVPSEPLRWRSEPACYRDVDDVLPELTEELLVADF